MTQFYIGTKQVEAYEDEKDGKPGYTITYPDGYVSWSPKETFEKAYLPMGTNAVGHINENTITQKMVEDFMVSHEAHQIGEKTTVVQVTLANGFVITESSSCVDPANYNHALGTGLCLKKIEGQVWMLLGFLLQSARFGNCVKPE